ncbi:MAG: O-antigen translocase [Winogradskyella sp.]|uniref:O-antigen translocase n=1 Tax=Winogradskyella sp. TaxID=1883156 RepID=UPI0025DAFB85|nr:O-antigen translocase [Winogradskyella sp.]NRB83696.1 O-antigen translocase [Winogradskyella sp.]
MKLPKFIKDNIVLKITSLNAIVISIRLIVSVFIQRVLAIMIGEAGIANIGQVRNLMVMLTSTSTLGIFNGVVKYVSEFKERQAVLAQFFSTAFVFLIVGSVASSLILFFGANYFSNYLFDSQAYIYVFQFLAVIMPFIAVNRAANGILNGLSDYKRYAKIDLISYLLGTVALLIGLYTQELDGVIVAIALAPVIQLVVLVLVFGKVLKKHLKLKAIGLNLSFRSKLLAYTIMSFVSSFLLSYIEINIRTTITDDININEAGYWTAMTFISKNYMVFATGLFTLYVIPKFANIHSKSEFKNEVVNIYKTILPIFGLGMVLVYLFRNILIEIIYPDFTGMEPLFKWQLMGDFVRLGALVLAHQFLAKRLVKSFVVTEILSLVLFFILAKIFIQYYSTEGVVIAHFVRYIIYFIVVVFVIKANFKYIAKNGD